MRGCGCRQPSGGQQVRGAGVSPLSLFASLYDGKVCFQQLSCTQPHWCCMEGARYALVCAQTQPCQAAAFGQRLFKVLPLGAPSHRPFLHAAAHNAACPRPSRPLLRAPCSQRRLGTPLPLPPPAPLRSSPEGLDLTSRPRPPLALPSSSSAVSSCSSSRPPPPTPPLPSSSPTFPLLSLL